MPLPRQPRHRAEDVCPPPFHSCDGAEPSWLRLPRGFARRQVAAGSEILRQGYPGGEVVLLCEGVVKLVHSAADGRTTIVGLRLRGSFLGVGGCLLGTAETMSAIALGPCTIGTIESRSFATMVRQGGELSWRVHLEHCREIRRELVQCAGLAYLSARERLECFLEGLAQEIAPGRPLDVELPLRDWELAQLLAITPQYLSRLMDELARNGRVRKVRNRWRYGGGLSTRTDNERAPSRSVGPV